MLFKNTELDAIQSGEVSIAFRRWRRPTVKEGGTLKTPIGLLSIDRVHVVDVSQISSADAAKAGYDRASLLSSLEDRQDGLIYRIDFHFTGPDPRIALREDDDLSDGDLEEIGKKLRRMDAVSKTGPWTLCILCSIQANPRLAAVHLSEQTGYDKEWIKKNIRKLKNLGLTISHQPGYELSPRGVVVTEHLKQEAEQGGAPSAHPRHVSCLPLRGVTSRATGERG
ncbi:MAG TPA: hypothetical protein PKE47_04320 [Verrucomicrobiota bacterium]|nr:hypothetical protein [Verrucomicrobiota bacterium]